MTQGVVGLRKQHVGQVVRPLHERIKDDLNRGVLESRYFALNLEGIFLPGEVQIAACSITKVFPYRRPSPRYLGWVGLTDQSVGVCVKFGRRDYRTMRIPLDEITAVGVSPLDGKSTQVTWGGIFSDDREMHLYFREDRKTGPDLVATLKHLVEAQLW